MKSKRSWEKLAFYYSENSSFVHHEQYAFCPYEDALILLRKLHLEISFQKPVSDECKWMDSQNVLQSKIQIQNSSAGTSLTKCFYWSLPFLNGLLWTFQMVTRLQIRNSSIQMYKFAKQLVMQQTTMY